MCSMYLDAFMRFPFSSENNAEGLYAKDGSGVLSKATKGVINIHPFAERIFFLQSILKNKGSKRNEPPDTPPSLVVQGAEKKGTLATTKFTSIVSKLKKCKQHDSSCRLFFSCSTADCCSSTNDCSSTADCSCRLFL